MQILVLVLILVVVTFKYLATIGWLPKLAPYLFEIISAFILLYVAVNGMRARFAYVRPAYWFAFGAIVVVMVCGIVLNAVEPGPIFAGLRIYVRPIPLFFLPAVFAFTDRQVRTQFQLLLLLLLIQLPVAVTQRMGMLAIGGVTGDSTQGTLEDSSFLSIALIGGICVVMSLFLRKRIRGLTALVLFLLLVVPTTINETKATFLLLPLAILTIFLSFGTPSKRLKNGLVAVGLLVIFGAIFIPVYDYLIQFRVAPKITDFFAEKGEMEKYLVKGARLGTQSQEEAGRIDSLIVPVTALAKDPSQLVFGYGVGNVTQSSLGSQFTGRHYALFHVFLTTTVARLNLELGLLGAMLVMWLYWLIFEDSRIVAMRAPGLKGALAAAWVGFTLVIVASSFYKDMLGSDALSCLFWYYSGLIAAERMRVVRSGVRAARTITSDSPNRFTLASGHGPLRG